MATEGIRNLADKLATQARRTLHANGKPGSLPWKAANVELDAAIGLQRLANAVDALKPPAIEIGETPKKDGE